MQRDRWAPGQLAREAAKNVFSLQSRLYGVLVFATIVGVAIPLYAAWESVQLREQLAQEAQSGRGVFVLAATDENSPVAIDRASCEALSKDPDVLSSGLLISAGSSDFVQVGTDIPVIEASQAAISPVFFIIADNKSRSAVGAMVTKLRMHSMASTARWLVLMSPACSKWHSSNTSKPTSEKASGSYPRSARHRSVVMTETDGRSPTKSSKTNVPLRSCWTLASGNVAFSALAVCSTKAKVGAKKITFFPCSNIVAIFNSESVDLPAPVGKLTAAEVPDSR